MEEEKKNTKTFRQVSFLYSVACCYPIMILGKGWGRSYKTMYKINIYFSCPNILFSSELSPLGALPKTLSCKTRKNLLLKLL